MVPGEGPKDAKGMVVGEAPGFKEVKAGRPFIGPSGRLLFTYLAALGLRREELYVTNVVKEIPLDKQGKVRRPYQDEIEAWASLLSTEITNVAPAVILCLGRTAVDHLTMGEDFGKNDGYYFTAWHPAHLLYGGDREAWLEQLRPFAEALGKFEYA